MQVTKSQLKSVASKLTPGYYAIDTETTGLRPYHGDRLFSLIISSENEAWYFNFQAYPEISEDLILGREETFEALAPFFACAENILFMHNAKFDLTMLAFEGVEVGGQVYDTQVLGRLLYNRNLKYSLATLCKEIGLEKSQAVDEYIQKNKLYTWVKSPGKEKRAKWPHYDKVPFNIIAPYGETDGAITLKLGVSQLARLGELSKAFPTRTAGQSLLELTEMESQLTKVCLKMERAGVLIDRDYCKKAFDHESDLVARAEAEFESIAGIPLVDSRITLAKAFDAAGEKYPVTEKGNASFTEEVLESFTSPLAQIVKDHRSASKRAGTYFANFLYFADADGRIHPNMRQAGTDTGRFSYSDPNLQNCSKTADEGCSFPVRRAFIPSPGYFFAMIDYEQVEYRVMLDYAGEMGVIRKIMEEGLDVHQATANILGVTRQQAKTLNFMLIYGGGAQKLADALAVTLREAQDFKAEYFGKLPKVALFINQVMQRANTRGFIFNAFGRVCWFPYVKNPKTGREDRYAYKAPNHLIQGCCADIIKTAMVRVEDYLQGKKSRMLLSIHDELLLEIAENEEYIIGDVKSIMKKSYLHKKIPLECSADFSKTSWFDKEPWK